MSIDMCESQQPFAESEIGELRGETGLGPRLVIDIKMLVSSAEQNQGARLHSLGADVLIRGAQGNDTLAGRAFAADAKAAIRQYPERQSVRWRLALDLTRQQVEAWERLRNGGDFTLSLRYTGQVSNPKVGMDSVRGFDNRMVTQSEWIQVLAQMGHRRSILLEVPVPDEAVHPALALATKELARARGHMLAGHNREAVGACRLALDALAHSIGEDPTKYDIGALVKNNPKLGKSERFAVLRRVLTILANPAHHSDPDAAAIEWHYEDAHAILAQTAATLTYHNARLLGTPQ